MIYPINIKPAPRVVAGKHKGAEITHIGLGPRSLEIYTAETVFRATPDQLPHVLQRTLGSAIKEAGRPGPFIITPEELAEDVTYDPDSAAPSRDKPEPQEVEYSHPKERKLKQELGLAPPETDEAEEIPKHEKFPPSLPSHHPKEKALERQREAMGEKDYGFDMQKFMVLQNLLNEAYHGWPDNRPFEFFLHPHIMKAMRTAPTKPEDFIKILTDATALFVKDKESIPTPPEYPKEVQDSADLERYEDEKDDWNAYGKQWLAYHKKFKLPPKLLTLLKKVLNGANKYVEEGKLGQEMDAGQFWTQVARSWWRQLNRYRHKIFGSLMGAIIETQNKNRKKQGSVEAAKTETDKPMFKKGKLDLTPFHLRSVGGAMFAKKSDAVQFAKKKGWRTKDITPAFNRFNEFYVIGQQIDPTTFRVLGPQGHVDLKFGPRQGAFLIDAKMKYLGQCDRLRKQGPKNEANWQEMMKQKKPISMSTFKSKADYKAILDEDETLKDFIAGDPEAGFFQSVWGNKKCVFLRTAGFEFIWV